jgi:sec-independent protein translocase protein TatC
MNSDRPLTLVEHLEELRARIVKSLIFIIIFSLILYSQIDKILPILIKPVGKLVFIAPQEAFITKIKIAFFAGLFLASPFVLYQAWRFVSVGLRPHEKKYTLIFGPVSFILFISGCLFGYSVIMPIGIRFLLGFATDFITPMITISKYISFIVTLILAFGVVFELPLVLLFLTKIGVVTPGFLKERRKEAVVIVFIVAAFLTPPDVITQILMALPLIFLYELGILFSRLVYKRQLRG